MFYAPSHQNVNSLLVISQSFGSLGQEVIDSKYQAKYVARLVLLSVALGKHQIGQVGGLS
jgi:hypothetical protein